MACPSAIEKGRADPVRNRVSTPATGPGAPSGTHIRDDTSARASTGVPDGSWPKPSMSSGCTWSAPFPARAASRTNGQLAGSWPAIACRSGAAAGSDGPRTTTRRSPPSTRSATIQSANRPQSTRAAPASADCRSPGGSWSSVDAMRSTRSRSSACRVDSARSGTSGGGGAAAEPRALPAWNTTSTAGCGSSGGRSAVRVASRGSSGRCWRWTVSPRSPSPLATAAACERNAARSPGVSSAASGRPVAYPARTPVRPVAAKFNRRTTVSRSTSATGSGSRWNSALRSCRSCRSTGEGAPAPARIRSYRGHNCSATCWSSKSAASRTVNCSPTGRARAVRSSPTRLTKSASSSPNSSSVCVMGES